MTEAPPSLKEEKERDRVQKTRASRWNSFVRYLLMLAGGKTSPRIRVPRIEQYLGRWLPTIATIRANRRLGHGGQNDQQRRIQSWHRGSLSLSFSLYVERCWSWYSYVNANILADSSREQVARSIDRFIKGLLKKQETRSCWRMDFWILFGSKAPLEICKDFFFLFIVYKVVFYSFAAGRYDRWEW